MSPELVVAPDTAATRSQKWLRKTGFIDLRFYNCQNGDDLSREIIQTQEGWWVLKDDPFTSSWIISEHRIDHHDIRPGLEAVWPYVRPGSVVVDAGAHLGCWTIPMLRAVGEGGTVISYEPDPEIAECLHLNVSKEINDLGRRVSSDIRQCCLSDKPASLGFMRNLDNRGGSGISQYRLERAYIEYLEVAVESLDSLMAEYPKVDILKLDIEGEELNALKSGANLLDRDHPVMFIEANPHCFESRGQTLEEARSWIEEHGYSVVPFPDINPHDFLCLPMRR